MTLKEEHDYFEADISPFEQYCSMLEQEKFQIQREQQKGYAKYEPDSFYAREGRKRLV